MTPPRPVEEVARAILRVMLQSASPALDCKLSATAALTCLRELGYLSDTALQALQSEGQYENTRPERFRFEAKEKAE